MAPTACPSWPCCETKRCCLARPPPTPRPWRAIEAVNATELRRIDVARAVARATVWGGRGGAGDPGLRRRPRRCPLRQTRRGAYLQARVRLPSSRRVVRRDGRGPGRHVAAGKRRGQHRHRSREDARRRPCPAPLRVAGAVTAQATIPVQSSIPSWREPTPPRPPTASSMPWWSAISAFPLVSTSTAACAMPCCWPRRRTGCPPSSATAGTARGVGDRVDRSGRPGDLATGDAARLSPGTPPSRCPAVAVRHRHGVPPHVLYHRLARSTTSPGAAPSAATPGSKTASGRPSVWASQPPFEDFVRNEAWLALVLVAQDLWRGPRRCASTAPWRAPNRRRCATSSCTSPPASPAAAGPCICASTTHGRRPTSSTPPSAGCAPLCVE